MSGISQGSKFSDTNSDLYLSGAQTVTTSEVEAKVGSSAASGRQFVSIFNNGSSEIYFGPSGVTTSTGEPLYKKQRVVIPATEDIQVFMICDSGTVDVIIQELG